MGLPELLNKYGMSKKAFRTILKMADVVKEYDVSDKDLVKLIGVTRLLLDELHRRDGKICRSVSGVPISDGTEKDIWVKGPKKTDYK